MKRRSGNEIQLLDALWKYVVHICPELYSVRTFNTESINIVLKARMLSSIQFFIIGAEK